MQTGGDCRVEENDAFRKEILAKLRKPEVCHQRASLLTRSYQETEGQPPLIRRARGFVKILDGMEICIEPWQIIVGNFASRPFRTSVFPEYSWKWILEEMETLPEREGDKFTVTPEVKEKLLQLAWWEGKSVQDRVMAMLPPEAKDLLESGGISSGLITSGIGQYLPGYERLLRAGLRSIHETILEKMRALRSSPPEDLSGLTFYQALSIVCEGVIRFAERYARLASHLSEHEKDTRRREELLAVAGVCRKVPAGPASNFHEAVQSFWFLHLLAYLEIDGAAISAGRLDQYLYPFFRKDVDSGRLTREDAGRILRSLWINFNQILTFYPERTSSIWAGYPMTQQPSLGGIRPDGRDATNELSSLMIRVEDETRLPQPDIAILYHPEIDRDFLRKAFLLLPHTMKPKIFNGPLAMEQLRRKGVKESEVHDVSNLGCVTTAVSGATWGPTNYGFVNLGKCVELSLNNGWDTLRGKRVGPETGPASGFRDFEGLYQAFIRQVEYGISQLTVVAHALETVHRDFLPLPFASLMVEDCIEKGTAVTSGGARYNIPGLQGVGLSTAADSLFALKKIVFEEGSFPLERVVQALRNHFDREDGLLGRLQQVPKYGNDVEEVDLLARRIGEDFCRSVGKHRAIRGSGLIPALYSISAHAGMGLYVGATPDGRRSRQPLADGISPGQGRCLEGPTAAIQSIARIDHLAALNGTLLNMKFTASIIQDPARLEKFIALIDAFMELGGYHVQFNVMDTAQLREAQRFPEKHPDLLVRVAAYVAQFAILPKNLQDDIIARSEFGL